MAVNLLHISDLHRDSGSQLTTTTLLHSLMRDRDRYCDGGCEPPDIAIVSGDVVYGVKPDEPNADAKLADQYNEAYDFLAKLADEFFSGDRERVVIVPGNHDVSMPHVMRSTDIFAIPEDEAKKKILASQLYEKNSKFRWDWVAFTPRIIKDDSQYDERMRPFCDFYKNFYLGKRLYSTIPSLQSSVHDFPELNICFAALSSCYENDLYNRTGSIHPEALTHAMNEIADLTKRGRVACAVWHHNLEGGPKDNDYVDAAFLQSLMDSWCSIGLHGHQHRPQLLQHRFSADKKRGISIVSAGTLCGGPRTLPPGRQRSYNLVKIDTVSRKGNVSIRQMTNNDFALPIWGAGHDIDFGGDSVEFDFIVRANGNYPMALAERADDLVKQGKYLDAFEVAKQDLNNAYLRRIALLALQKMNDWNSIIKHFANPSSAVEFLALLESYENLLSWNSIRLLIENVPIQCRENLAVMQSIDLMRLTLKGK